MKTTLKLSGVDHVGVTVPDLDQATQFFVEVLGCEMIWEAGPFSSEDDWMKDHLNVHPRAQNRIRMLRCPHGATLELFEYIAPEQKREMPANSDIGGHHIAFYVEDMESAVEHLNEKGVRILGTPTSWTEGPLAGVTFLYFLAPWGLQLEFIHYPKESSMLDDK